MLTMHNTGMGKRRLLALLLDEGSSRCKKDDTITKLTKLIGRIMQGGFNIDLSCYREVIPSQVEALSSLLSMIGNLRVHKKQRLRQTSCLFFRQVTWNKQILPKILEDPLLVLLLAAFASHYTPPASRNSKKGNGSKKFGDAISGQDDLVTAATIASELISSLRRSHPHLFEEEEEEEEEECRWKDDLVEITSSGEDHWLSLNERYARKFTISPKHGGGESELVKNPSSVFRGYLNDLKRSDPLEGVKVSQFVNALEKQIEDRLGGSIPAESSDFRMPENPRVPNPRSGSDRFLEQSTEESNSFCGNCFEKVLLFDGHGNENDDLMTDYSSDSSPVFLDSGDIKIEDLPMVDDAIIKYDQVDNFEREHHQSLEGQPKTELDMQLDEVFAQRSPSQKGKTKVSSRGDRYEVSIDANFDIDFSC